MEELVFEGPDFHIEGLYNYKYFSIEKTYRTVVVTYCDKKFRFLQDRQVYFEGKILKVFYYKRLCNYHLLLAIVSGRYILNCFKMDLYRDLAHRDYSHLLQGIFIPCEDDSRDEILALIN